MRSRTKEKQYVVDAGKVKQVQRIMKTLSEAAAIEEALQMVIDNDRLWKAHLKLVENGNEIVDTFERSSS